jgi:hypothetical protein
LAGLFSEWARRALKKNKKIKTTKKIKKIESKKLKTKSKVRTKKGKGLIGAIFSSIKK